MDQLGMRSAECLASRVLAANARHVPRSACLGKTVNSFERTLRWPFSLFRWKLFHLTQYSQSWWLVTLLYQRLRVSGLRWQLNLATMFMLMSTLAPLKSFT